MVSISGAESNRGVSVNFDDLLVNLSVMAVLMLPRHNLPNIFKIKFVPQIKGII